MMFKPKNALLIVIGIGFIGLFTASIELGNITDNRQLERNAIALSMVKVHPQYRPIFNAMIKDGEITHHELETLTRLIENKDDR